MDAARAACCCCWSSEDVILLTVGYEGGSGGRICIHTGCHGRCRGCRRWAHWLLRLYSRCGVVHLNFATFHHCSVQLFPGTVRVGGGCECNEAETLSKTMSNMRTPEKANKQTNGIQRQAINVLDDQPEQWNHSMGPLCGRDSSDCLSSDQSHLPSIRAH